MVLSTYIRLRLEHVHTGTRVLVSLLGFVDDACYLLPAAATVLMLARRW